MRVGSFGTLVFEVGEGYVLTPAEFSRYGKARYEEHKVLGHAPMLEFLSAELTTISLPIQLRADLGIDPTAQMRSVEDLCKNGRIHRLILCGVNYGFFVLESYQQKARIMSRSGTLFSVSVNLSLKEYF